jgi:RNA polymerase-binding transcription factor DksA
MRYLTIEQRDSLRNALTSRAATLRGQIASNLRGTRHSSTASLASRLESDAERELAELDGLESEIDGADVAQEMGQLRRVHETLTRLRSPDYGICADCDEDIPYTRLRDDPYTSVCKHCQQRRDLAQFVPNEM